MHARALLLVSMGVVCLPMETSAENGADIDLQTFRPAMDSRGAITVDRSDTLSPGQLSLGLVTSWGTNLVTLEDDGARYRVEHLITPTLIAALGARLGGVALELGASVPFGVMSGDRDPDSDGGTTGNPNDDLTYRFEGQGIGDVGLHAKARLTGRTEGLGAALVASVRLPTASTSNAWLGADGVTPQASLVLDRILGRVALAVNAGLRWRASATTRFVDAPVGTTPSTGGMIEIGASLPVGGALAYALAPGSFDVIGELYGEIPLGGTGFFPLEAIAGVKLYLARSSYLTLGGGAGILRGRAGTADTRAFLGIVFEPRTGDRDGDGLKDDVDACPDAPEDRDDFADTDGCPDPDNDEDGLLDVEDACPNEPEDRDGDRDDDGCPENTDADRDGDGFLDAEDRCPDQPEDIDSFRDDDGCPDVDNDGDGILDIDDLCPDDPEDRDDYEDDDGCPERGPAIETDVGIDILENIYFEFDSAIIQQRSHRILRAVATVLRQNTDIRVLEIQGHTDARGAAAYNLRLSQQRADAVRRFLIAENVDENRLKARGYGESRPLVAGGDEAAWSRNRRVEFVILRRASD